MTLLPRCLYHWVELSGRERGSAPISRGKAPAVPDRLSAQVVAFVQRYCVGRILFALPGVAETHRLGPGRRPGYLNE